LKYVFVLLMILVATTAFNSNKEKVIILSDTNTVVLDSEVTAESVDQLIAKIQNLNALVFNYSPIYLFLRSPGGSIEAGLDLIEFAKTSRRPVHTISAFSASMAFQIAQALGDRYVISSGVLMSHRASGGFEGAFGGLRPSQLDSRYNFWLQRLKELDQHTVDRTKGKQTLETYLKAYSNEMWLTGPQSVEQGYADELVGVSCNSTLSGTVPRSATFLGFHIEYEVNKCPMSSGILNAKIDNTVPKAVADMIIARFKQSGQN
jgi:ATP-dependent protease ClpP protease subunit